ncbi:MAG TPA: phosphotransferase [Candidatus Limnocylindrales bacterium]
MAGRRRTVGARAWIRGHVASAGPIEVAHDRSWATVWRVPIAGGTAWFKACATIVAFEPALTVALSARWPDRTAEVVAADLQRGWLLLADAGTRVDRLGNPPELWLRALPRYAELQRGESRHASEHLAAGVPDLRLATLPERYEDLIRADLPIGADETASVRAFASRFVALCEELAAVGIPDSLQHDDLHLTNLYLRGDETRVLDWGDASIGHPFASLVETFRFLEEFNGLRPDDPWFGRLRDAYLEPWGSGLRDAFELGLVVGGFAHAIPWLRQRAALPRADRPEFDSVFAVLLRRALRASDTIDRSARRVIPPGPSARP